MASLSKGKEPAGYYPTQWSNWELDEASQRYKRYRLRNADEYEFEWERERSNEVPRYLPPIADLAASLQKTTINSQPPNISTKNLKTKQEKFDPNYKVHKQWEFTWGRVFKVLWAEPKGNGGNGADSDATFSVREGKHGETHWEKVRRFLIVNQMEGHCICLPINTYSSRGTLKNGVHAEHHAIIYTDEPEYFEGEWERGLTRPPIRMTPDQPRHKLQRGSRLNYAKTYTVEYNVKVWFIGKIDQDSQSKVVADYNDVHPPMQAPRPALGMSLPSTVSYTQGGATSSYQEHSQYPHLNQPGYNPTSVAPSFPTQPLSILPSDPLPTSQYPSGPSSSIPEEPAFQSSGQYPSQDAGSGSYGSRAQGEFSSQTATQQNYQSSRFGGPSGGQDSSRGSGSRSHHSTTYHKSRDREDDRRYEKKRR